MLSSHSTVSYSSAATWTEAHQAPLSMGFPRQENWNGLPFPSPGDLPDTGIEPMSPAWQADSTEPPGKLTMKHYSAIKKNEIMLFAATRMNLEIITLTEVS